MRRFLPELIDLIRNRRIDPGKARPTTSTTGSPSPPAPAAAWGSTRPALRRTGAADVLADVKEDALRIATDDDRRRSPALGGHVRRRRRRSGRRLVERTVDAFGRLDMAFNNAGIMLPLAAAADEPAEAFDRVTAINLRGVWACMKHQLRQTRAQSSGAIVNCSPLGGLVGSPGRAS